MRKTVQLLILMFTLAALGAACSSPAEREAPSIPPPPNVDAPPPQAQKSSSGLAWIVLQPGKGTRYPRPNSQVTVHYTGWTTDGESFDSSVSRGEPASFALNEVIAGWTEGVQMMVEGEKRRFCIPAELAYGNSSRPGAPQGLLVFDIELIRIGS
jgi:FKBP-type peptidyl-prolyl cis-trans isomerase